MVFISPDHKVLFLWGYVDGGRLTCLYTFISYTPRSSGLEASRFLGKQIVGMIKWSMEKKQHTPLKTNMTLQNPNVPRKPIFKWWIFQPVILVLRGVYWKKIFHMSQTWSMNYSLNGWIPYLLDLLFQSPHLQWFFLEPRGLIAKRRGNHLAVQTPWHPSPRCYHGVYPPWN